MSGHGAGPSAPGRAAGDLGYCRAGMEPDLPGAGPAPAGEVRRARALAVLARRWELPVTTVVAAGGFGKTTLLRQAVAENRAAERGVDVVVGCRPFDREADALAGRILAALDAPPTAEQEDDPVVLAGAVVGALAAQSPRPVCLALDDVHELGEDTSATELVRVLVRTLPGNGHLLLSGRRLPATLPRARLRAADAVAEVGEDELSFDDDELVGLADHHGLAPDDLAELGRWPALVRLSITAGRRESMEFLRQEVLDDLAPDVRRALGVAVLAGAADDALLVDLGGLGAADLAAAAPLVDLDGSGAAVPHALWREVVDQLVDEGTTRDLVGAIADRLVGAGSYDEALDLLAGAGRVGRRGGRGAGGPAGRRRAGGPGPGGALAPPLPARGARPARGPGPAGPGVAPHRLQLP